MSSVSELRPAEQPSLEAGQSQSQSCFLRFRAAFPEDRSNGAASRRCERFRGSTEQNKVHGSVLTVSRTRSSRSTFINHIAARASIPLLLLRQQKVRFGYQLSYGVSYRARIIQDNQEACVSEGIRDPSPVGWRPVRSRMPLLRTRLAASDRST